MSSSSCTASCIQTYQLTGTASSKFELKCGGRQYFVRSEDLTIVSLVSEQKYRHSVPCGDALEEPNVCHGYEMGTEFTAVRKQRPKGALKALGTVG